MSTTQIQYLFFRKVPVARYNNLWPNGSVRQRLYTHTLMFIVIVFYDVKTLFKISFQKFQIIYDETQILRISCLLTLSTWTRCTRSQ